MVNEDSELKELWADSDEFEGWQKGIAEFIERLSN
jgi:hypothetical protein